MSHRKKPTDKKPDNDDKKDNDKNNSGVTGTVNEDSAENNGKRLPKTGKEERAMYIYIGMAFILLGGVFCLTGKRKGKNKKSNE